MPENFIRKSKWQRGNAIDKYVASRSAVEQAEFYTQILTRSENLALTSFFKAEDPELLLDLAYDWLLDEPNERIQQAEQVFETLYDNTEPWVQKDIRALVAVQTTGLSLAFLEEKAKNERDAKTDKSAGNSVLIELELLWMKRMRAAGREKEILPKILRLYDLDDFPNCAPIHLAYYQRTAPEKVFATLANIQHNEKWQIQEENVRFYDTSIKIALQTLYLKKELIKVKSWVTSITRQEIIRIIRNAIESEFFDHIREILKPMELFDEIEQIVALDQAQDYWEAVQAKAEPEQLKIVAAAIPNNGWKTIINLILEKIDFLQSPTSESLLPAIGTTFNEIYKAKTAELLQHLSDQGLTYERYYGYLTHIDDTEDIVLDLSNYEEEQRNSSRIDPQKIIVAFAQEKKVLTD